MARPKPITIKINPILPQYHDAIRKYIWVIIEEGKEPNLATGTLDEWKDFIKGEILKEVEIKIDEYFTSNLDRVFIEEM